MNVLLSDLEFKGLSKMLSLVMYFGLPLMPLKIAIVLRDLTAMLNYMHMCSLVYIVHVYVDECILGVQNIYSDEYKQLHVIYISEHMRISVPGY